MVIKLVSVWSAIVVLDKVLVWPFGTFLFPTMYKQVNKTQVSSLNYSTTLLFLFKGEIERFLSDYV